MAQVSKEIIAAKEKAEADLLKLPGVTGVDIGYKEVGGQKTGVIAIRVLVEKKKAHVPEKERVPAQIDGHPTDVIERKFELHPLFKARKKLADLVPEADTGTYTPLKGGISIGPARHVGGYVYAGTLGAIVTDNVTGNHMLLSNFHVMCIDNGFHVGDLQVQPSLVDGGSSSTGVVGALARESLGGSVDCAVASISGSRGEACEIVDIGMVAGTNTATLGEAVRKRGRTTGLTYGIVDSVSLSVSIDYGAGIGTLTLTNQIGLKPDTAHNAKFGDHGDSGSVVVNSAREVVGLYFAGADDGTGVANPIDAVLQALNVKMCTAHIKIKDIKDIKLEKIEHKDKHEKVEIKEKEFSKDIKDAKHEKLEIKERIKEHKELKHEKLEKIEIKDRPDKEPKEFKEGKEIFEGPGGPGDPGPIEQGLAVQGGSKLIESQKKLEKPENKDIKLEKHEHKEGKIEKNEGKSEGKDLKDHKHEKNEAKEHIKDFKEKSEAKDHKDAKHEKIEIKEHVKELKHEKIEAKDFSKLEHAEKPLGKEKDGKELKEGGFEGPGGPGDPGGPVERRLGALEQAVGQLTHFIGTSQRPDLAHGALTGEKDLAKQMSTLSKEAADAKSRKDAKDTEKYADR